MFQVDVTKLTVVCLELAKKNGFECYIVNAKNLTISHAP
jgi:hypothetical protein